MIIHAEGGEKKGGRRFAICNLQFAIQRQEMWVSLDELAEFFVGGVPRGCFARFISFYFKTFAHDRAEVGKGGDFPQGHGLDEQVSGGGGFGGTGDDGFAAGVGGHLVEQLILAAASDNVDDFDALAEDVLQAFERAAVGEGEAFEAGADEFAGR